MSGENPRFVVKCLAQLLKRSATLQRLLCDSDKEAFFYQKNATHYSLGNILFAHLSHDSVGRRRCEERTKETRVR